MKTVKLRCSRGPQGRVFVKCPVCRTFQELPLDEDWYEVDHRGKVFPMFVCMEPGRKCQFEAPVWIVNWNGG